MRGHTKTFRLGAMLAAIAVSTWFVPAEALAGAGELGARPPLPHVLEEDSSAFLELQQDLWGWAWGAPYVGGGFLTVSEATAPPPLLSPADGAVLTVTARHGDVTIGTAAFVVLDEIDVSTAMDAAIEPQLCSTRPTAAPGRCW
jgi:hypothetical protein